MKKINLLLAILFTTLLTGCTKDESVINDEVENETNKGTQMQLTVAIPENENPRSSTRVSLNSGDPETPLNVELTWKVGDKIYLIFSEGGIPKGKQTVELKSENITNDSKKANFSFTVPAGIGEPFDLYGVHGGGGFVDESSYTLKLPTAEQSTGRSLAELSNNNAVMLKFAQTGISKASPSVSVSFAHIGSLFRILLKSDGFDLINITKAELNSTSYIPVHQNLGSATYNPVTDIILGTTTKITLAFNNNNTPPLVIPDNSLTSTKPFEFWGWFIPEKNKNWPWLGLNVTYATGGNEMATRNFKEARTTPLAAGKAYHFYATHMKAEGLSTTTSDDTFLKFTNRAGTPDENTFTDTRDNNVYKIVLIGDQFWMKENLKYLPNDKISYPFDISIDNPSRIVNESSKFYYVYNHNSDDKAIAKNSDNYKNYGVLYNWLASQDQYVCPPGWRLPNNTDWSKLSTYLGGQDVAGGKLKLPIIYKTNTGATNTSDFTALLGGRLNAVPASDSPKGYNAVFDDLTEKGYWWSNSGYYEAWSLNDDDAALHRIETTDREMGYSVRCVRD